MKKYNIQNYIRYKEDLKASLPVDKLYQDYTRDEMIVKFLPLVEAMARKFSTSQQASGILTIMDLFQFGSEGLTKAVDRLEWDLMKDENKEFKSQKDIEQTLKSFFSCFILSRIPKTLVPIKCSYIFLLVISHFLLLTFRFYLLLSIFHLHNNSNML